MTSNKSLTIRPLEPLDAATVAEFINSQPPEYLQFFYAFKFEEPAIREMLIKAENDLYSGVYWQGVLIGIFFLRGWDAGYKIPSFGAMVDEKYRGKAILNLTFDFAKLICKLSGVNQYMVKIHPENIALQNIRRRGFYKTGIEESTGNVIFHLDF